MMSIRFFSFALSALVGTSAFASTSTCNIIQNNCTNTSWSQCDGGTNNQVDSSLVEIDRLTDLGYKIVSVNWISYPGGSACVVGFTLLQKQ